MEQEILVELATKSPRSKVHNENPDQLCDFLSVFESSWQELCF